MKKLLATVASLSLAVALSGCGSSATSGTAPSTENAVDVEVPESKAPAGATFEDGVFTTSDVTIKITDYRVIPVGEVGNEYGDVPVLAIWYETTNLGTSDRDISSVTEFVVNFEAFQDNDPNIENRLGVGMLPDDAFLDSQMANIKAGGAQMNAVAYELTDTTTPVELIASSSGDEVGRMTINLT